MANFYGPKDGAATAEEASTEGTETATAQSSGEQAGADESAE